MSKTKINGVIDKRFNTEECLDNVSSETVNIHDQASMNTEQCCLNSQLISVDENHHGCNPYLVEIFSQFRIDVSSYLTNYRARNTAYNRYSKLPQARSKKNPLDSDECYYNVNKKLAVVRKLRIITIVVGL